MHTHAAKDARQYKTAELRIPIAHCSERDFLDLFRADLATSTNQVTILSPFLSQNRAIHYYPVFHALTARQVVIEVYSRPRHEQPESLREHFGLVERGLQRAGVQFHVRSGMHEKVGVIDGRILWHGSLNILSHNDTRESMLRFESPELVHEVLSDLGLTPYAIEREMSHPMAAETGTSEYGEKVEDVLHCPRCRQNMHYFESIGMWICSKSPHCPGTLTMDAVAVKDQGTQVDRRERQTLAFSCPLCHAPMEVSHGVFVRVVCSSPGCGFALDPRLSSGMLRMLQRRGIV
jgi:hypothetical protein